MTDPTRVPSRVRGLPSTAPAAAPAPRGRIAACLFTAVVVVDQATKWEAWRHAPRAIINQGSTWFIGRPVNAWVRGADSGRIVDLLAVTSLALALVVLLSRSRSFLGLMAGTLLIAGWSSNVLDRLGMHALTAPGSRRGVVDFIPVGGNIFFNVADVAIVGATVLALVAVCGTRVQPRTGPPRTGPTARLAEAWRRADPTRGGPARPRRHSPGA